MHSARSPREGLPLDGQVDILFLITDLAVGGAENQLQAIATRLSRRGWQVAIVSLMRPAVSVAGLERSGVAVDHLGLAKGSWDPTAIPRLREIIRSRGPRLVHAHMVHANLLARAVRPIAGMPPLICTSHSMTDGGELLTWGLRLTDRLANLTTHVSKAGLARYVDKKVVRAGHARWVPNGVDLTRFARSEAVRGSTRRDLGVRDDEFLWLSIGRLSRIKGHDRLLRALAQLDQNATLALAGDGPLLGPLTALARDLGIDERVRFLGLRPDPDALMSAADAFVLSSNWEALPLVLLEASAARLPIVCTDVGGCREVVRDGVSGSVVETMDPGAMAAAMRATMNRTSDEREAMGIAGRRHVESRYDMEKVVEQWEALYRSYGSFDRVSMTSDTNRTAPNQTVDAVDFHGVLLTYRRPDALAGSLKEITGQRTALQDLVVVDNAPSDASTGIVSEFGARFARLTHIPSPTNVGPAGGRRLGSDAVLKDADDADWIIFFDDDDPLPTDDLLARLAASIGDIHATDPHVGGVGLRGANLNRRTGRVAPVRASGTVRVGHLHGGFFPCYRVGALRRVGSFDPDLVFGFEELDLGLRLEAAGFTLYALGDIYGSVEQLMDMLTRSTRLELLSRSRRCDATTP